LPFYDGHVFSNFITKFCHDVCCELCDKSNLVGTPSKIIAGAWFKGIGFQYPMILQTEIVLFVLGTVQPPGHIARNRYGNKS